MYLAWESYVNIAWLTRGCVFEQYSYSNCHRNSLNVRIICRLFPIMWRLLLRALRRPMDVNLLALPAPQVRAIHRAHTLLWAHLPRTGTHPESRWKSRPARLLPRQRSPRRLITQRRRLLVYTTWYSPSSSLLIRWFYDLVWRSAVKQFTKTFF